MGNNTPGTSPSPVATEAEESVAGGNQEEAVNTESTPEPTPEQTTDVQDSAGSSGAGDKPDDAKAESSKTLLDVVKDAVKSTDEEEGSSSSKSKQEADSEEKADSSESKDETKGDKDELPPFHNHPRWKELQQENKNLKPQAEQFQKIETFMGTNNLTPTEVAQGFKIMALIKNDPARALEELNGYAYQLQTQLGYVLPKDLQDQVDDGRMTEEAARELSVTRQREQRTSETLEAERKSNQAAQQEAQLNTLRANISTTITQWESDQKKRNPDYAVLQPMVLDRVRAIVTERGYGFESVQDAKDTADKALKDVQDRMKSFAPRRNKTVENPDPPADRTIPVSTEPKTLGEAIRQAVA